MNSSFFVPGIPVPKGSAKGFCLPNSRRVVIVQTNRDKQKPWASLISVYAQNAGVRLVHGPVSVDLVFLMPRPKSHYGTGKQQGTVKLSSPDYHTSKPDIDKLARCVLDALTGVAWLDDSQVVSMNVIKTYTRLESGCAIKIQQNT